MENKSIGFGASVDPVEASKSSQLFAQRKPDDLVKFGLIPEFIGRLPVIATLEDLDEAMLIDILTKPKNALVRQFQTLFEIEVVNLDVTDEALRSEEHTSALQSLMRISYAVSCLKKKTNRTR